MLRRLRRFHRRLIQLCRHWDDPLYCKLVSDKFLLSRQFPELAQVHLQNLERDVQVVDALVSQKSQQEKEKSLQRWKENLHQIAWIKRKTDAVLRFEATARAPPTLVRRISTGMRCSRVKLSSKLKMNGFRAGRRGTPHKTFSAFPIF